MNLGAFSPGKAETSAAADNIAAIAGLRHNSVPLASVLYGQVVASRLGSGQEAPTPDSVQAAGDAGETRKQIGRINARPICHVDTRLDIDAIRRGMENKKLEMMGDGRPSCRIGFGPACTRPVSGSEP
jgi:hypothetical protein